MQFKTDEQLRKYLTKRVEFDLGRKTWSFNGIKFNATAHYFEKDFFTAVEYVCDLRQIQVTISRERYPILYEIIGQNSFNGDDAISKCITWVVDKLIEIYKLLNERIAPYANDKRMYDLVVNRPIALKEAQ